MNVFTNKLGMLLSFLSLSVGSVQAQGQLKNAVYAELGGNGLFGSFNYERQLTKTPALQVRLGLGIYTENSFYLTVPVGLNYLIKLNNEQSFIDAGFGTTWSQVNGRLFNQENGTSGKSFLSYVPSVGYRRHTVSGYIWRLNFTPVINQYGFVPWAGLSFGKRF